MYRIILFAIAAAFEFLKKEGDNYLDWSLKVKAILTDRQLWDIVEGTDDPPKAEKNGIALGLIKYSCFGMLWQQYAHSPKVSSYD